jgi:hypothetical protein
MSLLRNTLRKWLGIYEMSTVVHDAIMALNEQVRDLRHDLDAVSQSDHLPQNFHTRLSAMEATLKRVHDRLEAIGSLPMGEVTMMEAAEAEADRRILADKERRDRSAAEARGMTLTEYYADVQRRKDERSAREAMQ